MKRFGTFAGSLIFAAVFAVSVFGQAQPGVGKIGWIVTQAFGDDKEGITKYVNAEKALETEMRPRLTELQTLQTKLQTISEDIKKMTSNPAVPVNQQAVTAKQDEGQRLQREYEFKQKEAQAQYAKRREEVLGPIQTAILAGLQDYAKLKGYSVVLDISAMGQGEAPNPVLVLDASANITKDFIVYYNARPATTATTAAPR